MTTKITPVWICTECGDKHGKWRGGPDAIETFHDGTCEWCGREKPVCHYRRYGYPEGPKP